jgi:hypothetical protein
MHSERLQSPGTALPEVNAAKAPAFQHPSILWCCAGVLSTAVSARLLLGLGLMATAAVNLAFGASSSMTAFCTLWGINGMLQVRRWYNAGDSLQHASVVIDAACLAGGLLQHAGAWAPCREATRLAGASSD